MQIRSMTGFSSVTGGSGSLKWRLDAKSVNAKGLDLKLRLPAPVVALEADCRRIAQARLARGTVAVQMSLEAAASGDHAPIDEIRLAALLDALIRVRQQCEARGVPVAPVTGDSLALAPGVLTADSAVPQIDEVASKAILEDFATLIEQLDAARCAEGEHIGRSIAKHLTQIESLIDQARAEAGEAIDILRQRLRRQIQEFMGESSALDPGRLEQEVALLATKADIREEIDRLTAHCIAARQLLAEEGAKGRKLDFLTQEFNREANTLCSKAPTDALTRIGLDLKAAIDQMKEQAANVE